MNCQLICPNLRCRKILKVPEEARGKVVRCQHCETMLRVPTARRGGSDANGPLPMPAANKPDVPARHVA